MLNDFYLSRGEFVDVGLSPGLNEVFQLLNFHLQVYGLEKSQDFLSCERKGFTSGNEALEIVADELEDPSSYVVTTKLGTKIVELEGVRQVQGRRNQEVSRELDQLCYLVFIGSFKGIHNC